MSYDDLLAEIRSSDDVREILGISADAGEKSIREAFERQWATAVDDVRKRKIYEAYERIRSETGRMRLSMISPRPLEKPEDLLLLIRPKPRFVGPGIWLKTIRELESTGKKRNESTGGESI